MNHHYQTPGFIFSLLDLTSLDATDHQLKIAAMAEMVLSLYETSGSTVYPAAVCVYPTFVRMVKEQLAGTPVKAACVTGGFPSGQTYTDIKEAETRLAVEQGADEIDMVINRGEFMAGNMEFTFSEILTVRETSRDKKLKVILETGELRSEENIYNAADIAIKAGADFVKTSTGKSAVSATPEAARAICTAIRDHYRNTGKKTGCKISGGVASLEDALIYQQIVFEILGREWMTPELFRIGASRLANDLLNRMKITGIRF